MPEQIEPIRRVIVPLQVKEPDKAVDKTVPKTVDKPEPARPVLDESLGPDDLRIKVSCEVIGRYETFSKVESDEKFPFALQPESRGGLSATFEKCIRTLISIAATRVNHALNEPVLEPAKVKPVKGLAKMPVIPVDAEELTQLANPRAPLPEPPNQPKFPTEFPPPPPPPPDKPK